MEGDDRPFDELKRGYEELLRRVNEIDGKQSRLDARLTSHDVLWEENGYKVDARREH
jgi:hypothetical protein